MKTSLARSSTDRMFGGVCGGLARYLGVDSTLVRFFFILLTLAGHGIGILIYIALLVLLPSDSFMAGTPGGELVTVDATRDRSREGALLIGAAFVLLGAFLLLENLGIAWLRWVNLDTLWPVLLVLAGGALLWRSFKGG